MCSQLLDTHGDKEREDREKPLLRDAQGNRRVEGRREAERKKSLKIAAGFSSAEIKAAVRCFLFCCCSEVFPDAFLPVKSKKGTLLELWGWGGGNVGGMFEGVL